MNIPAIVITGPRRTGTHLMYRLLDGHPKLFNALVEVYFLEYVQLLSPETQKAFVNFWFSAQLDELFDIIHERELLPCYRGDLNYEKGAVSSDNLRLSIDEKALKVEVERQRQNAEHSVAGIWNTWFNSLQTVLYPDIPRRPAVIKSPDYGKSALSAHHNLPAPKTIFIVRDPIYALSSLRQLRANQPHRWKFTTLRMLTEISDYNSMLHIYRQLRNECPSQVIAIRYEDLIREFQPTMQKLVEFLNIDYDAILSHPTFNFQEWHGDSSFETLKGISDQPLNRNRILLTDQEKEIVSENLADFLVEFCYDSAHSD
jgi:hypothetical protein